MRTTLADINAEVARRGIAPESIVIAVDHNDMVPLDQIGNAQGTPDGGPSYSIVAHVAALGGGPYLLIYSGSEEAE